MKIVILKYNTLETDTGRWSVMKDRLKKAEELLKKYKQEQLLRFYNKLNENEKEYLLNDISQIDFKLIRSVYKKTKDSEETESKNELKPLTAKSLAMYSKEEKQAFYNIGRNAIKDGKVAVYLVAGGQGSRLGHDGPKGTYSIGLPSGKSLFQLQCERIIYLSRKVEKDIPMYIMTSTKNNDDTVNFFEENNYFGYKKEIVMFIKQGNLPAVDEDGKILLSEKNRVNMCANGNGGCFIALKQSGALDDMKKKGVEWVFLCGVDNALVKMADPLFIGFTICSKQLAASKVVAKRYPEEKVGLICYKNNKPAIVEYSEIPKRLTEERNEEGKLLYSNSNILNHILNIRFIEAVADASLPLHIAHKKIEYIDELGRRIAPDKPNGYKFEYFLFDVFERLEDMAVLEVEREAEFAPVKNKEGEDSPKTARELILNLHKKWLADAGVDMKVLEGKEIEISPLVCCYKEFITEDNIKKIIN